MDPAGCLSWHEERDHSSAMEPHPPFTLEAAQEGVSLQDGRRDVVMTRMNQGPCALAAQPAVPVRKLLNVARVEAPPHGYGAVSPGIGQQPL